jgi:hypothetical protein
VKLSAARELAGYAVLDACLSVLSDPGGALRRRWPGLTDALDELYVEASPALTYEQGRREPPSPVQIEWLSMDWNNLWPASLDETVRQDYFQRIRTFFPLEKYPRNEFGAALDLKDNWTRSQPSAGLVMRACHPETVVFLEVNSRALIPIRWTSADGAARYLGATAFLSGPDWNKVAPLRTRRFRVPVGVLRPGVNQLRVWTDTALEVPDPWVPTLHGVFLTP